MSKDVLFEFKEQRILEVYEKLQNARRDPVFMMNLANEDITEVDYLVMLEVMDARCGQIEMGRVWQRQTRIREELERMSEDVEHESRNQDH